jgi:hypothetical protein
VRIDTWLRILMLGALAAAACARIRPLEGGPPDREPPRLVRVIPRDSSLALGPTPVLELEWSERIDPASLRRAVRVQPAVRFTVEAHGARTRIVFVDSLPADTTLVVVIGRALRDAVPRDNAIASEIILTYATGAALRGATVFGRVTVQERIDARAAVLWRAVLADSLPARRVRPPIAGVDTEGGFQLAGLPAGTPGLLIGFQDRNGDLQLGDDELATAYPETLRLAAGSVRRGLQWNILDPSEPGTVRGVVQNRSGIAGPLAVAVHARPDTTTAGDSIAAAWAAAGDTLPARSASPYALDYAALGARGFVRREWVVVYASPRGDYSMRVPPGRHALFGFVDARRDSAPGLHGTDSTLAWEPLTASGSIDVTPGGTLRLRSLEIGPRRDPDGGKP